MSWVRSAALCALGTVAVACSPSASHLDGGVLDAAPPIGQLDGGHGGSQCGVCDGCCSGRTCVPIATEDADHCGRKGSSCKKCNLSSATSLICSLGACVEDTGGGGCDATSCSTGCCDPTGTYCITADVQSADNCGTGAAICSRCPNPAVVCTSGQCTTELDINGDFSILVSEVHVQANDATNQPWDSVDGPDPFVCFSYTDSQNGPISGCTRACANQADCMPAGTAGLVQDQSGNQVTFFGEALLDGTLYISVWQSGYQHHPPHPDGDVQIGAGTFPARTTYMDSYSTGPFGQVANVSFSLIR